jgi:CRP/FNR family transcriptional regulator, cyclic AMP receptor protein
VTRTGGDGFAAGLSADERAALFAAGRRRRYPRHARVFHEGDRSDFVIVIVEGRVKIVATAEDGSEALLSVREPGALVGELAALDEAPRLASAVVLEPLTAIVLTAEQFRAFVADHPRVALQLMSVLIGRLREADRRRVEFGAYDVAGRLARLLIELTADHEGPTAAGVGAAQVHLSQHELAGLIGASRESVARALGQLRSRGLLTTGRRTIAIADLEALRSLAG